MWQHSKKTKFKLHCSENGAQQFYKWMMCRTHRCAFWYIRKAQTGRIGIIIASGMLLKGSGVETVELLGGVRDLRRWSLNGMSLEARPSPPPCFLTAMRQMNRFATPHSPQYCFSTLPKPKEPTNHKLNHEQEKSLLQFLVCGCWRDKVCLHLSGVSFFLLSDLLEYHATVVAGYNWTLRIQQRVRKEEDISNWSLGFCLLLSLLTLMTRIHSFAFRGVFT